eukprot:CAMPEP_0176129946 /NCGR_PEP_ID=MMETSP0120_2-20121206/65730_1 /TAXON_ID=160619 /ORGANISM="Kryptoperidinium foliaceum, Strain CCMP 1326" /LENGTH=39 /DNA_ID= /DNA_START= /DNA_END= /DNA_ORIENTATION=
MALRDARHGEVAEVYASRADLCLELSRGVGGRYSHGICP